VGPPDRYTTNGRKIAHGRGVAHVEPGKTIMKAMRIFRYLPLAAALLACTVTLEAQTPKASAPPKKMTAAEALAHANDLLSKTILVDGHNDLPWAIRESKTASRDVNAYDLRKKTPHQTDLARMKAGKLGAQFWSVYVPGEVKDSGFARIQLEEIDIARQVIARYPESFTLASTVADLRAARKAGKVGSMLGMEGGHAIENSLGALRAYYALGARYMTLTHNVTLDWADAALDKPVHKGLTPFGKEVVREMNRLGMLVDLSHVSPGVMSNALDVTEAPVIFSHSSARALVDHPRNVPDSILKRLPKNGGVVMVTFVPGFDSPAIFAYAVQRRAATEEIRGRASLVDSAAKTNALAEWVNAHPAPHATIADVANHIDYIATVAGHDHVGIGSDFDGVDDELPDGLQSQADYPKVFAELIQRGWSDTNLRKLAGENVLRALSRAEVVARELQKKRPASTRTIEELDGRPRM
jgi:membrane dipeptidase